jgi:hypothetical protein
MKIKNIEISSSVHNEDILVTIFHIKILIS